MKEKKNKAFLLICLAFFTVSVIDVLRRIIVACISAKAALGNGYMHDKDFGFTIFINLLIIIPLLLEELACIRSAYKLLKYKPQGFIKICYVFAVVFSFVAVVFHWLIFLRAFDFAYENAQADILFATQTPTLLVSFVLGSLPVKPKKLT